MIRIWPLVSVIIITYDRLHLVEKTLNSFLERCNYPRNKLELILCDDCSPLDVHKKLDKLPFDIFIFSEKNKGLGHNANKGIKRARGKYILQLQDDWISPKEGDFIHTGIEIMEKHQDIGMIKYEYKPDSVPSDLDIQKIENINNNELWVLKSDKNKIKKGLSYSPYTDRPHLKSKFFHEKLGLYKENTPMTKMEIDFVNRFSKQDKIKIGYLPKKFVFEHIGSEFSWNPGVKRENLRRILLKNKVTKYPFRGYLFVKHSLIRKLFNIFI